MTETSGAEADDQAREAMAYNYSIYLMAGMPFLLLATFSFLVFRGLRLNAAAEPQALGDSLQAGKGGSASCPPQSTVEDS